MENETELIAENPFIKSEGEDFQYTRGIFKKRPVNILDSLHFQSDDYKEYKLSERVKNALNSIDLENRYVEEIIELCRFYAKKAESPQMPDLISIVTYKVIKHYHLPISRSELITKLKIDKRKFLKFSKFISVINQQNQGLITVEEQCEQNFSQRVYDYLTFLIKKLSEYSLSSPEIFKEIPIIRMKDNGTNLLEKLSNKLISSQLSSSIKQEDLPDNLNSSLFTDIQSKLSEIKTDAKNLIYKNNGKRDESFLNFYEFFGNKILIESLSAAMIKFLLEKKGIKLQLDTFKNKFKMCPSGISKGIKMIKEYTKLIDIYY